MKPNPKLDLVLQRVVDVEPQLVWRAWTDPEELKKWFTPRPWTTTECEIDLRPGGIFRTVMRSPEGQEFPYAGCYLEVVDTRKLVWTNLLLAGFRPAPSSEPVGFTATISLEPHEGGTRYTALVMHKDEASRQKHDEMGFAQGWSTVLDQLVALAKSW